MWDGDEWLDTFDNESDAIDYRAAIAKAIVSTAPQVEDVRSVNGQDV